jgi:hypothetical protein
MARVLSDLDADAVDLSDGRAGGWRAMTDISCPARALTVMDIRRRYFRELRRMVEGYFPLVPYYNLRPADPNLPRAAEWLAERRARGG